MKFLMDICVPSSGDVHIPTLNFYLRCTPPNVYKMRYKSQKESNCDIWQICYYSIEITIYSILILI